MNAATDTPPAASSSSSAVNTAVPPKKRQKVVEEDADDADMDEVEDVVSHMMQMTLYVASKNTEPPLKKRRGGCCISASSFRAPRAEVFSVMREEDDAAHALSGFVVSYGREMFVLPVSWLRKLNLYRDFAYGTRDVYSAFPLGEIARKMSDDHDEDLNACDGRDDDADFSSEEIDAVRRAFVTRRGGRGRDDDDDFESDKDICTGEGFIDLKKVVCAE